MTLHPEFLDVQKTPDKQESSILDDDAMQTLGNHAINSALGSNPLRFGFVGSFASNLLNFQQELKSLGITPNLTDKEVEEK